MAEIAMDANHDNIGKAGNSVCSANAQFFAYLRRSYVLVRNEPNCLAEGITISVVSGQNFGPQFSIWREARNFKNGHIEGGFLPVAGNGRT